MITDSRSACPHGYLGPWNERPCRCKLINVACSEVCIHMRVADTLMWAGPLLYERMMSESMVQLYGLDRKPFSAPITRGEAGYDTIPIG